MVTSLKKVAIGIAVGLIGIVALFCQNPAGGDSNKVDGITSSTGQYFHLDSVRVTATTANLYWRDHWDDGDAQQLKYGTDKTYALGTINLLPLTPDAPVKTTIPNLIPGTRYFAQFYRLYEGSDEGSVAFEFTTAAQ